MIRLEGDDKFQQPADMLTAAEVKILRVIHGDDGVVDLKENSVDIERTKEEELERLNIYYKPVYIAAAFPAGVTSMPDIVPESQRLETARDIVDPTIAAAKEDGSTVTGRRKAKAQAAA